MRHMGNGLHKILVSWSRFLSNCPASMSEFRISGRIFSNGHTWALELKETGEAIGCIGYYDWKESNIGIGEEDAELGYWLAKPYWNRGFGTEAVRGMVDWCFNKKGFQTLWADFFVDNPASGRVMEKCGFRDTGKTNYLSHLYRGDEKPVKIMRLDYAL